MIIFPAFYQDLARPQKDSNRKKSRGSQILNFFSLLFGDDSFWQLRFAPFFREFTIGKTPSNTWKQQKVGISKTAEIKRLVPPRKITLP